MRMHLILAVMVSMVLATAAGCAEDRLNRISSLCQHLIDYAPTEADNELARQVINGIDPDIEAISDSVKMNKDGFLQITEGMTKASKFRVLLLYFIRQPVPRGLTDDELEMEVKDGKLKRQISTLFESRALGSCISVLEQMGPEHLKDIIPLVAGVYYTGRNPHSSVDSTWAADSQAELTRDILMAELASHCTAAKLLIAEGVLKLPEKTTALFRWSGKPSIDIPLSTTIVPSDIARLRALLSSPYGFYRMAAGKALDRLRAEKIPEDRQGLLSGVCYGPFRDNEDPDAGIYPDSDAVQRDLNFLSNLAHSVRTYGATKVLSDIGARCEPARLDCYPGAWISTHRANNAKEIENLIAMCAQKRVRAAIVGNEVLLRKDQTEDQMIQYVRMVKKGVKVPVTCAETWKVLLDHRRLVSELDFLLVHIHPYWDGIAIREAPSYVINVWRKLKKAFPDKRIVIGETGWPSDGTVVGKAVPSAENQGRFLTDFVRLASSSGVEYFIFEAFDENWKEKFEGNVGAHWGIYRSDGSIKKQNCTIVPAKDLGGHTIERPRRDVTARNAEGTLAIYTDWDAAQNSFFPSGWMGDLKDISLDDACRTAPRAGQTCIRVTYKPSGYKRWSGIYWQYPGNNWGKFPGYDLTKSSVAKLTFWARGEHGGEKAEFKIGGINRYPYRNTELPYQDSLGPLTTGVMTLTTEWKQYNILLNRQDLSNLIGGFCWVTNADQNPGGCTIYLDEIRIQ